MLASTDRELLDSTTKFCNMIQNLGIPYTQDDINCGPLSHPDFIKNDVLSNFLNFILKFPQFYLNLILSSIFSNFLKFSQISSQILHILPAWLAGWNN